SAQEPSSKHHSSCPGRTPRKMPGNARLFSGGILIMLAWDSAPGVSTCAGRLNKSVERRDRAFGWRCQDDVADCGNLVDFWLGGVATQPTSSARALSGKSPPTREQRDHRLVNRSHINSRRS